MILNEYQQIIREHFDISDRNTRKFIIALEDAQQDQLLNALASSLYNKIVEKVDKIDFGTIPKSRGDITKVEGFENTVECLNIIRKMVIEYKDDTSIVDTILSSIEYIKQLKPLFLKSFTLNSNFGTTFYNLIVMAIEQSVSFMIATTIQYIKDTSTQSYEEAFDKAGYNNTKDNMLYQQLVSFNKSCASGEIDQLLRESLKNGGKLSESIDVAGIDDPEAGINTININVGAGQAGSNVKVKKEESDETHSSNEEQQCQEEDNNLDDENKVAHDCPVCNDDNQQSNDTNDEFDGCIATPTMAINGSADSVQEGTIRNIIALPFKMISYVIKFIIPMIRNITYFIFNSIVSFSDSLAVQAQLIEMNAYKLQYSTNSELDDEKKKKVIEKQLKIAAKLKSLSSKFAIDQKKAKKAAEKMAEEEAKKNKINTNDADNISSDDLF